MFAYKHKSLSTALEDVRDMQVQQQVECSYQKCGRWLFFFLNRYCIFQKDETEGTNFEANFIFPLLDSKIFPVYSCIEYGNYFHCFKEPSSTY